MTKKHVNLRITKELYDCLEVYKKSRGLTRTDAVEGLLADALEADPTFNVEDHKDLVKPKILRR